MTFDDLLTFPGWIALWSAIVVVLIAYALAVWAILELIVRTARAWR